MKTFEETLYFLNILINNFLIKLTIYGLKKYLFFINKKKPSVKRFFIQDTYESN